MKSYCNLSVLETKEGKVVEKPIKGRCWLHNEAWSNVSHSLIEFFSAIMKDAYKSLIKHFSTVIHSSSSLNIFLSYTA